MEFVKTADPKFATQAILGRLRTELASGKKILWLLSGGSNIASEASILASLRTDSQIYNLTVMLMDERYGPVGHADSNWQQLQAAGCDFTALTAIPVMEEPEKSLEETVDRYARRVADAFASAELVIAQFGLGTDGHTAGILPNSPAALATSDLVIGYHAPPYDRITLTRQILAQVDVAYLVAYGEAKLPALKDLKLGQKPFAELPAMLLSELPEVYVYNDQLEGDKK